MAAGRFRPKERVLYVPELEKWKVRMHMTRTKTTGEVTGREKTEKRAIVGPCMAWKVQNCKGNIPARTVHKTAMEQTYPQRVSDLITGAGDSFQLTPSIIYVYSDVSEERANFIFAKFYVLPTVYPGTTLGKWPTWCTITSGVHTGWSLTENTTPDAVLIQFDFLMMSTELLETCRGL